MAQRYYKTNIPWLGSEFLLKSTINNSFTAHFSDGTSFCSCSFSLGKDSLSNGGPCPQCTIKCEKHVEKHNIQANSDYLKHALRNKKTHVACAFCQYENTKVMDKHTKKFFEMPYHDDPSFSFLSNDSKLITSESTCKKIVGYYNGRPIFDPFDVFKGIGYKFYNKRIGVKEGKQEIIDLTDSPPTTPAPIFTLEGGVKKPQRLMKKKPKTMEERGTIDLEEHEKEREANERIATDIYNEYINNAQKLVDEHKILKNQTIPSFMTVLVGFLSQDKKIIFKVSDFGEQSDTDAVISEHIEEYEVNMTNKAASVGLSKRVQYHKIFKTDVQPSLSVNTTTTTKRFISIRIMETVEGEAFDRFYNKNKMILTELDYQHLTNEIADQVKLMHSYHIYHKDLHAGNIMVVWDNTTKKFSVKFIDFTYRKVGVAIDVIEKFIDLKEHSKEEIEEYKHLLHEIDDLWILCYYTERDLTDFFVPVTNAPSIFTMQLLSNPQAVFYLSKTVGNFFVLFVRKLYKFLEFPSIRKFDRELLEKTELLEKNLPLICELITKGKSAFSYFFSNRFKDSSKVYKMGDNYYDNIKSYLLNEGTYESFVYYVVTILSLNVKIVGLVEKEGKLVQSEYKYVPLIGDQFPFFSIETMQLKVI